VFAGVEVFVGVHVGVGVLVGVAVAPPPQAQRRLQLSGHPAPSSQWVNGSPPPPRLKQYISQSDGLQNPPAACASRVSVASNSTSCPPTSIPARMSMIFRAFRYLVKGDTAEAVACRNEERVLANRVKQNAIARGINRKRERSRATCRYTTTKHCRRLQQKLPHCWTSQRPSTVGLTPNHIQGPQSADLP
jgi:hypothetical protein